MINTNAASTAAAAAAAAAALVPFHVPFEKFSAWLQEATDLGGEEWPNAMTLATSTPDGFPSARIVLMQRNQVGRIAWYTNYNSRKGREIEANPRAAVLFYWNRLQRQVRMEGIVKKATAEESDEYFNARPRESRIASIASAQSEVVACRDDLIASVERVRAQFQKKEGGEKDAQSSSSSPSQGQDDELLLPVTRPPHIGMYWLEPSRIELWQDGEHRLHDRNVYELAVETKEDGTEEKKWKTFMLNP